MTLCKSCVEQQTFKMKFPLTKNLQYQSILIFSLTGEMGDINSDGALFNELPATWSLTLHSRAQPTR